MGLTVGFNPMLEFIHQLRRPKFNQLEILTILIPRQNLTMICVAVFEAFSSHTDGERCLINL